MTRQVSDSEKFRTGSMISDMSGGGADSALSAEISGDMITGGHDALGMLTAEEDAQKHVEAVVDSFENDADNDSTLLQMISMELDERMRRDEPPTPHAQSDSRTIATAPATTDDSNSSNNAQCDPATSSAVNTGAVQRRVRIVFPVQPQPAQPQQAPAQVQVAAVRAARAGAVVAPMLQAVARDPNDKLLNALIVGTITAMVAIITRIVLRAFP